MQRTPRSVELVWTDADRCPKLGSVAAARPARIAERIGPGGKLSSDGSASRSTLANEQLTAQAGPVREPRRRHMLRRGVRAVSSVRRQGST